MSIKLKHNKEQYQVETILWDRDSYFIDFNGYWSRLIGAIAQKIAENTTTNWGDFNIVRTQTIKLLGINPETSMCANSGPVSVLPVNIYPHLLTSGLMHLMKEKKQDELNDLFQKLVDKAMHETKAFISQSVLLENIELVRKVAGNVNQLLITNDSNENNEIFLNSAGVKSYFSSHVQANKCQLDSLLKENVLFVTGNSFLKNVYEKRSIKNVLLVENVKNISFDFVNEKMLTVYVDGASKGNPGPASIGIVFYLDGEIVEEVSESLGNKTNNFAEYTALIRALEISLEKGYKTIEIKSDSELVVKQINKLYKVKDCDIKELFDKANNLIKQFSLFKIVHIPREENLKADKLANKAILL